MTYPVTPLDVEVGLFLGGAWVDAVTTGDGVLHRNPITVSLGRGNWAGESDPARLGFTLRNSDGRWSPDLVTSPYFGLYKRNIPCRMGVGLGTTYLTPTDVGANVATTPNHASLDITGDIDLRIDFQLHKDLVDTDDGGAPVRLAHRTTGTDGWEWELYNTGGTIYTAFTWADSGGVDHIENTEGFTTSIPITAQHDRIALRVTLDVNNGSGGYTITFWTADTIAGTFEAFASTVTASGTTSIKTSTAVLKVGGNTDDVTHIPLPGRIHAFQLRSSIGGTQVANPDFTTQTVGASSFADAAGRTWTIGSGGRITNMRWRFHGELASLPVRWDLSGNDITAPVEATGIFRRLRQGNRVLESPLRRATLRSAASVVQYWPCEDDGTNLTQFGAAVGISPMVVYIGGPPTTATNTDFPSSAPLPEAGTTAWATWVDSYTATGEWQVRWLMSIADTVTTAGTPVFRVQTDTGLVFEISYRDTSGGQLMVEIIKNGTSAYTSAWTAFNAQGVPFYWHLECTTSGANISYALTAQEVDGSAGGIAVTDVVTGVAPGSVNHIIVNQDATIGAVAIGHITLQSEVTATAELADGLTGYVGELAGHRIQRLCREEGVAFRIKGDPADTEPMGVQRTLTLPALLQECAATDGGLLAEARDSFAVAYRTRVSMQAQTGVTFDYSAGEVAGTPELDRDDQGFANDVTVSTVTGGIGRAVLNDSSALSVSEPPTGAGRYNVAFDANCAENRAGDLAGWRLHLLTVDEPRCSRLSLDTNLPAVHPDATLTAAVIDLGLGDLIEVTDLPATVATNDIRQIVQGIRETITSFGHRVDLLTTPARPWDVGVFDGEARYDTAGSILADSYAQGVTAIDVATLLGPLWTTDAGDFPFDILVGGARVTVSAIGAVSSGVQEFTISALPIARDVGFPVMLADPAYYEL